jgi:hypothetical protein
MMAFFFITGVAILLLHFLFRLRHGGSSRRSLFRVHCLLLQQSRSGSFHLVSLPEKCQLSLQLLNLTTGRR